MKLKQRIKDYLCLKERLEGDKYELLLIDLRNKIIDEINFKLKNNKISYESAEIFKKKLYEK